MSVVCISTAGKGARIGALGQTINKALLPYKNKAILSQIIDRFPEDVEFLILLGYKADQVLAYVANAHPRLNVQFQTVDRFEGIGTGPGYSLLFAEERLQRPFYYISCDTIFDVQENLPEDCNWIGVAPIEQTISDTYCTVAVENGVVHDIRDKEQVPAHYLGFSGLMYVFDYQIFWDGLRNPIITKGEHQISSGLHAIKEKSGLYAVSIDWLDLGDLEKYQQAITLTTDYDFSKTNEFLYFVDDRVIKFFEDATIAQSRVDRARLKPDVFPIIQNSTGQFYSYLFLPGDTFYKVGNLSLFDDLLNWLDQFLWARVNVDAAHMRRLCTRFYRDKTLTRVQAFRDKYPDYIQPAMVNGEAAAVIEDLLTEDLWAQLVEGVPAFIHGDLQFDNILYDETSRRFALLDWRQDFAGELAFGDLYYDLAKLLGGIFLNYDYIKANLFTVIEAPDAIEVDFAQRFLQPAYTQRLEKYVQRIGLDFQRVRLLQGIIYINMAPLHVPPFDLALHALGRLLLTHVRSETNG